MSPSFSISVPEDARVSCVSFSRSRIISSTAICPTMARRWPANTLCTRSSIWPCWSRKRRAALAMDAKSSPTLKMTTPLMPSGIPWWVTQSIASSASRRSRESFRTFWTKGITNVPLPVTMRNPRVSSTPSGELCSRSPEMMSASFGSATCHIVMKRNQTRRSPTTMMPPIQRNTMAITLSGRILRPRTDPLLRVDSRRVACCYIGVTTTVRGGKCSMTTTRSPTERVSPLSAE
jgi:hypothetical protein